jgi:hypothetical protein
MVSRGVLLENRHDPEGLNLNGLFLIPRPEKEGTMRRSFVWTLAGLFAAGATLADVSVLEHRALKKNLARGEKALGSQALTDASGLEYLFNTDVTFATSSSASGAASEASYTGPVAATTSAGGTVSTTLSDAFDGYNGLCVSLTNATGPCATGDPDYVIYNDNGPAATECGGRQVVLNPQAIGPLTVQRKVFVPATDEFARWVNIFTNTSGATVTFTVITSNNLGSDADTTIAGTSDGDTAAEATDHWVSTFEAFSGGTSFDPRLGHVLQGPGAPVPLSGLTFADGNGNPYWSYALTLRPGETRSLVNFVTGQPSRAEANAKAAELAGLPEAARQCLTDAEAAQIANFLIAEAILEIPTVNEVGLAALGLLLGAAALVRLRRRAAWRRGNLPHARRPGPQPDP